VFQFSQFYSFVFAESEIVEDLIALCKQFFIELELLGVSTWVE